MQRLLKKKLLLGLAVAAIVAGATAAAVMASQSASHPHRGGVLATAAGYLGVSPVQLKGELKAGRSLAQIADATPGRSAAGLIEALESSQRAKLAAAAASLPKRITSEVDRTGRRGLLLSAAAGYLAVSPTQLREQLRAGETLAQLAKSTPGRSEAGLVAALVAAKKAALAGAVKAGTIDQARANATLAKLQAHIAARVNHARHAHAGHRANALRHAAGGGSGAGAASGGRGA